MSEEKRNEWLVENIGSVTETITRYCKKHERDDFEELYLEIIEWLIGWLDKHEEPPTYISQLVGNKVHKVATKKDKHNFEEPHFCFELLYSPDFYKNLLPEEVCNVCKLTDLEKVIFMNIVYDELSFKQCGMILGHTQHYIRCRWDKIQSKIKVHLRGVYGILE